MLGCCPQDWQVQFEHSHSCCRLKFLLQIWQMQPTGTILNAANDYCLTLAASSCGHLGVCRPGMNMTYGNGTDLGIGSILHIGAQPCDGSAEQVLASSALHSA